MSVRPAALAKGLITYLPGGLRWASSRSGGTDSVRYCYSIWLRHLVRAAEIGHASPRSLAELGPGDSLGLGLAAVLTGADRYWAFDIKSYTNPEQNGQFLERLLQMFRREEPIPGPGELPDVWPPLKSYEYPRHLLTPERMSESLRPDRLTAIRRALNGDRESSVKIAYAAPWNTRSVIQYDSIDMVYSQAVLEHVNDLADAYRTMCSWLKPGGLMSHTIDFKSHGLSHEWSGHWSATDVLWRLVSGRRSYLINRVPHSVHVEELRRNGFAILTDDRRIKTPPNRDKLAPRFRMLSDADLSTAGTFIQAIKRPIA